MAWKLRTTCLQCHKPLAPADRKLGPVCGKCARRNSKRIWDESDDRDRAAENDRAQEVA